MPYAQFYHVGARPSRADILQFRAQGFLRVEQFFSQAVMKPLRSLVDPDCGDKGLQNMLESLYDEKGNVLVDYARWEMLGPNAYSCFFLADVLVNWVETLIGIEKDVPASREVLSRRKKYVRGFYQCYVRVPPLSKGRFRWHRDFSERWKLERIPSPDAIAVLISIGESSRENGGLNLIPGSHKYVERLRSEQYGSLLGISERVIEEVSTLFEPPVDCPLGDGGVVFIHPNTIHSNWPNRTGDAAHWLMHAYTAPENVPAKLPRDKRKLINGLIFSIRGKSFEHFGDCGFDSGFQEEPFV